MMDLEWRLKTRLFHLSRTPSFPVGNTKLQLNRPNNAKPHVFSPHDNRRTTLTTKNYYPKFALHAERGSLADINP